MREEPFDWLGEAIIFDQAAIAAYISDAGYIVIRQKRDDAIQEADQLVVVLPGNVERLITELNDLMKGA